MDMEVIKYQKPAPPPAPAPSGPLPARLPLKPGVVRRVTAMERSGLEAIGWREGDPIPENLAENLAAATGELAPPEIMHGTLQQLEEKAKADLAAELAQMAALPPLNFDEASMATPVEKLSPQARSEFAAKLASLAQLGKDLEARKESNLPPSVVAAIETAFVGPGPATFPAGTYVSPIPASPSPETVIDMAGGSGATPAKLTHCPHCRWDLNRTDLPEPNIDDKRHYQAAFSTGSRFTKTVTLMGGHLQVTFRELKVAETTAINVQVSNESSPTLDAGSYMAKALNYMAAASIESVELGRQRRIMLPTLADIGGTKPVADLLAWAHEHVAQNESLWRVLTSEFYAFRRVLEWLEANATSPDFYAEIPGPA